MVSRKESWLGLNLRMKILVVDDNQEITDVLSVFCESQEIEIEAINDSKKALPAIRKHDFDLMLLDIAMPEFTGLDIINSLKDD
jgi:two-component system OmpR family response regulator